MQDVVELAKVDTKVLHKMRPSTAETSTIVTLTVVIVVNLK